MKHIPALFILAYLALCGMASAQTKAVTKTISTDSLVEGFTLPSGKTITIAAGATITNSGTATGFGSSTPGGSTTQLQFNNAGAFGGVSGWTTNGTTTLAGGASTTLSIGGGTAITSSTNLATYAGITPSANVQSILGAADYAAINTLLGIGGTLSGLTATRIPFAASATTLTDDVDLYFEASQLCAPDIWSLNGLLILGPNGANYSAQITPTTLWMANDGLNSMTLSFTAPTATRTIIVPDADGTMPVSASGNIALSAAGNITFTGTLPVANGGTGATTLSAAGIAILGANTFTSLQTSTGGTNSPTPTNLHLLTNTTAATAGGAANQSASPSTIWTGAGWKTNATAASQPVSFRAYVLPVQGAAAPTAAWTLGSDINATGTYSDCVTFGENKGAAGGSTTTFYGTTISWNVSNFGLTTFNGNANYGTQIGGSAYLPGITLGNLSNFGISSGAPSSAPDTGLGRAAAGVWNVYSSATTVGGTFRAIPRTATQVTADQDNYNPGGSSYYQRWSTDASRNITGLSSGGTDAQVDGQTHVIVNVGSFDIVLKHDTTSTEANQFRCSTGADITLTPGQAADVIYDATAGVTNWRVFKRN